MLRWLKAASYSPSGEMVCLADKEEEHARTDLCYWAQALRPGLRRLCLRLRTPASTAGRSAADRSPPGGIEAGGAVCPGALSCRARDFAAAAAELGERPAEALLTADCKEFAVQDSLFAIGTVETASPATLEPRIPELYSAMQGLAHERGYSVLLFMIVDILELRSRVLIWGGERAVAEVLGVSLAADGHSVLVEGLVSRKKQVVPLLTQIQATLIAKRGTA